METHSPVLPCCLCVWCQQAKRDWFFIAMPNAMGVAFNTISLFLCAVLPAKDRQASEEEQTPNVFTRYAPVRGGLIL